MLYVLNDLGLEAVAVAYAMTAPRMSFMRFTVPYQPYSFQVVAPRATLAKQPLIVSLWLWTSPFSYGLWLLIIGNLVFQTYLLLRLETYSGSAGEFSKFMSVDAGGRYHVTPKAVFRAIATGEFQPHTGLGRVFALGQSFSAGMLRCFYVASLATWLHLRPTPHQLITQFDDFASTGLPACVANNSAHLQFMASTYPSIPLRVVGPEVTDMLDAVLAGVCYGGVANEVEMRWPTNQGDPQGKYCSLQYVGRPSQAQFPYAIPVTADPARLSPVALTAISAAIVKAQFGGQYAAAGANVYIPERSDAQCSAWLATRQLPTKVRALQLGPLDLAGIFLLIGLLMGLLLLASEAVSQDGPVLRHTEALAALLQASQLFSSTSDGAEALDEAGEPGVAGGLPGEASPAAEADVHVELAPQSPAQPAVAVREPGDAHNPDSLSRSFSMTSAAGPSPPGGRSRKLASMLSWGSRVPQAAPSPSGGEAGRNPFLMLTHRQKMDALQELLLIRQLGVRKQHHGHLRREEAHVGAGGVRSPTSWGARASRQNHEDWGHYGGGDGGGDG